MKKAYKSLIRIVVEKNNIDQFLYTCPMLSYGSSGLYDVDRDCFRLSFDYYADQ